MIETIIEALQFEFMRNAMMAGILVSVACGIIGTFVVVNRIVFVSGGIAHSAYGGIGLGYFFRFNPVLGAIAFALISALAMGWVERKMHQRKDTVIGVMWAIAFSNHPPTSRYALSDAVQKEGQYYCSDACANGHPDGAGCSHNGCGCQA